MIVIGGGQAGLSVGYHLKKLGLDFVILDASARIGDAWRKRWDTLRLFTPARYDGLDGMPFPGPPDAFPTKDEMADYLERYAAHFQLPVRNGVRVDRLSREGDRYLVEAGALEFEAEHVVVAMASYQGRKVPGFAQGAVARDRPAPLQRVQVAVAAEARRRAPRGRRQLGRGDRDGDRGARASDVDLGPRRRRRFRFPSRTSGSSASSCRFSSASCFTASSR